MYIKEAYKKIELNKCDFTLLFKLIYFLIILIKIYILFLKKIKEIIIMEIILFLEMMV